MQIHFAIDRNCSIDANCSSVFHWNRNVVRIIFLGLFGRHKRQKGGVDCHTFIGWHLRTIVIGGAILLGIYVLSIFQWIRVWSHRNSFSTIRFNSSIYSVIAEWRVRWAFVFRIWVNFNRQNIVKISCAGWKCSGPLESSRYPVSTE